MVSPSSVASVKSGTGSSIRLSAAATTVGGRVGRGVGGTKVTGGGEGKLAAGAPESLSPLRVLRMISAAARIAASGRIASGSHCGAPCRAPRMARRVWRITRM